MPKASKLTIGHRITSFLFSWRNDRLVERAACDITGRCRAGLGWLVYRRAADMSVAEIRGYVRALAWQFVCREVEQMLVCADIKPHLRDRVVNAAVEKLMRVVSHDAINKLAFADKTTLAA
jgi:hypothetical protein